MDEKIETTVPQASERKIEVRAEELENIRNMLQEKTSIFIVRELFPDFWEKEYISLEAKYGDVDGYFEDWLSEKEIPEDVKQTFQRLHMFITSKSPEEIFELARNLYEGAIKSKSFNKAYNLAARFFDKSTQDEAVRSAFNAQYQRMSSTEDPIKAADCAEAFFTSKFGELSMEQATNEQLQDIFEHVIQGTWAQVRENGRKVFTKLRSLLNSGTVEIKNRQPVRDFFHEFAREAVENYLKGKRVDPRTVRDANFFEKHGLLSLEKDTDLFEELTKVS